ncbi:calcium-activated chloride channel regulator 4A-like [Bufo gargarizans]|uniref:calcium-activated chloride channel regulator 4A-like n=1 Tax=Bufo gargarizans TaxID=30331 RepID=UPI001CF2D3AD|nr:calcium-activated chloride channel regulator 4A-like [Bufo gargarizans]
MYRVNLNTERTETAGTHSGTNTGSTQDMVRQASRSLFNATKYRLYFQNVKILIPSTWSNQNYTRSKTETYDQADVVIASPYISTDNGPYTLQYGQCGEPGRYIHLTPNFMLTDMTSIYGPRGKVLLHEWAHLRWGVYDEYNLQTPFYFSSSGGKSLQATRCSSQITGILVNKTMTSKGPASCTSNNITRYNAECQFLPNTRQFPNVKSSIMYMQSLDNITEFCNSTNHNIEASNLQNKMCDSRSTWDVIQKSTDISSTPPRSNTSIPDTSFTLLQPKQRTVTLVLDVSGSMSGYNRIGRLNQAASIFLLQIVETGSSVGIVSFSTDAYILSELVKIENNSQRESLQSLLPTTTIAGTDICKGTLTGIEVNNKGDRSAYGTEILLLTDGEDSTFDTKICFQSIMDSGVIVHSIALGPSASKALEDISNITGGIVYTATDTVDANGLINAFSRLQSGSGNVTQQVIQLESSASSLAPYTCINGTIVIDSTVGFQTVFTVTWQNLVPRINIQGPNGIVYSATNFLNDTVSKLSSFEIPGKAQNGPWQYRICNLNTAAEAIAIVVNSKAAENSIPPVTVEAHMNSRQGQYPSPMVIYASVSQGLLPVTGASVTALIEDKNGKTTALELLDNGSGPDIMKNDGIYSKYFTQFSANGRYGLKVRVENNAKGKSRLVLPKNRALYVPGYIINGTVVMNPPRPEIADEDLNVGEFSRTASGGSFLVSNVPSGGPPPQQDLYKPDRISDLEAKVDNDMIVLSWTATGDDLDQGNVSSYDLRMNTNPSDLRTNFNGSAQVDIATLTPLPAGSRETFSFVPENVVLKNGTVLFFALVAVDKVTQRSDVSNIAQAALLIPPTPASNDSSDGLNVTHITLIVCAAVIAICIIISITVCIVSCQRRKSNPEVRV